MPGKPYDREFEKQRWAIIREQQRECDRSQTQEERAADTAMLFNAWRWRFIELGDAAEPTKPSGWIEFHRRYAARRPSI